MKRTQNKKIHDPSKDTSSTGILFWFTLRRLVIEPQSKFVSFKNKITH